MQEPEVSASGRETRALSDTSIQSSSNNSRTTEEPRRKKRRPTENRSEQSTPYTFPEPLYYYHDASLHSSFHIDILKTISTAHRLKQSLMQKQQSITTELKNDSRSELLRKTFFEGVESVLHNYCSARRVLEQLNYFADMQMHSLVTSSESDQLFQQMSDQVTEILSYCFSTVRSILVSHWQKIMSDYVTIYEQSKIVLKSDIEIATRLVKKYNQLSDKTYFTLVHSLRVKESVRESFEESKPVRDNFIQYSICLQELLRYIAEVRLYSIHKDRYPVKSFALLKLQTDTTEIDSQKLLCSSLADTMPYLTPDYSQAILVGNTSQETEEEIVQDPGRVDHLLYSVALDPTRSMSIYSCRKHVEKILSEEFTFISVITEELMNYFNPSSSDKDFVYIPLHSIGECSSESFQNEIVNRPMSGDMATGTEVSDLIITEEDLTDDVDDEEPVVIQLDMVNGGVMDDHRYSPEPNNIAMSQSASRLTVEKVRYGLGAEWVKKKGRMDNDILFIEGISNADLDAYYINYFGNIFQREINDGPNSLTNQDYSSDLNSNKCGCSRFKVGQAMRDTLMSSVKENLQIAPVTANPSAPSLNKYMTGGAIGMVPRIQMLRNAHEFYKHQVVFASQNCSECPRLVLPNDSDHSESNTSIQMCDLIHLNTVQNIVDVMKQSKKPPMLDLSVLLSRSSYISQLSAFLANWMHTKVHEVICRPIMKELCILHHELTVVVHLFHGLIQERDYASQALVTDGLPEPNTILSLQQHQDSSEFSMFYYHIQILLGKLSDCLNAEVEDMCHQYISKSFENNGGAMGPMYQSKSRGGGKGRWYRKVGIAPTLLPNTSLIIMGIEEIVKPAVETLKGLNKDSKEFILRTLFNTLVDVYLSFFKQVHTEQTDMIETSRKSLAQKAKLRKTEIKNMSDQMEEDMRYLEKWVKLSESIVFEESQEVTLDLVSIKRLSTLLQALSVHATSPKDSKRDSLVISDSTGTHELSPQFKAYLKPQQAYFNPKKNTVFPLNTGDSKEDKLDYMDNSIYGFLGPQVIRCADESTYCF